MRRKVDNLKLQCKELAEHRRVYHVRSLRRSAEPILDLFPDAHFLPCSLQETHARDTSALPQAAAAYLTSLKPILQYKGTKKAPSRAAPHVASEEPDLPLSDPQDAHYNPEAYKRYKRKLRAATAEAYKGLEVLKNYRILNLTGFRKALKKFEKATKVRLKRERRRLKHVWLTASLLGTDPPYGSLQQRPDQQAALHGVCSSRHCASLD